MTLSKVLRSCIVVLILFADIELDAQTAPSYNCSNEEIKKLYFMVGDWQVKGTYRLNGVFIKLAGKSSIHMDLGGCLLTDKFSGYHDSIPYEQVDLYSYRNGSFYRATVETDHGHISLYIDKNLDDEFSFIREGNGRIMNKHKIFAIKKNSFETETYLTRDSGENWELVQTGKYLRL